MDTFSAFARGMANQGKPMKVFDWAEAARLIKKHQPQEAVAGLSGDMEYTSGTIYADGKIVEDSYTYLASNWATPCLELDGEHHNCYVMEDETEWDAETKWPPEARAILEGSDEKPNVPDHG